MAVQDVGAEANALFVQLTQDFTFPIPTIDINGPEFDFPFDANSEMYAAIPKITTCDLTTREIGGDGVFDALMDAVMVHLRGEYDASRITGAEYTKSYIASIEAAMANGTQFLLQRDAAYWQAQTAQINAITARVQLANAKMQMVQTLYGALGEKARYALAKMQALVTTMEYKTAEFTHTNMQPIQKDILDKQSDGATLQNEGLDLDNQTKDFQLNNILQQQYKLLGEQIETARAQTMETRTDGTPVFGAVGKQKDLYAQQIISYQRKAEMDAAKMWSDAWTVQKTIDEGLAPPTTFTNAKVDEVLNIIRTKNGLA